jgi:hypothetical protein
MIKYEDKIFAPQTLEYVYLLLEKDDKAMQRLFWDFLIDRLKWNEMGKPST